MKALSVVSPSGRLIASGRKTLEVRRWRPDLCPSDDLLIVENHRFLRQEGEKDENGTAIALCNVQRIRPFAPDDMAAACASSFEEGWLAWELVNVRPVSIPGYVLAARGIYDIIMDELSPQSSLRDA